MNRSGSPGCLPAHAPSPGRGKNREGVGARPAPRAQTPPHGKSSPSRRVNSACTYYDNDAPQPCGVDVPADWERDAVDLTACNTADKNRGWRALKARDPASAAAISRDYKALAAAFGRIGVQVPRQFIQEDV